MVITYQLKIDNFWDVLKVLILKNSFIVFPVLWKTCYYPQHFSFIIIILQLGKLQFYNFDISLRAAISYFALEKVLKFVQLKWNSCFAYKDLIKRQDSIKKRQINKFLLVSELEANGNKEYKIKAIQNNAIYAKKVDGQLSELYNLVVQKSYLKDENIWKLTTVIIYLCKMISSFYKNYSKK